MEFPNMKRKEDCTQLILGISWVLSTMNKWKFQTQPKVKNVKHFSSLGCPEYEDLEVRYTAILIDLQSRGGYADKIRGCMIDSGGDSEIYPEVWAAGFFAAILRKHSSSPIIRIQFARGQL